MRRSIVVSLLAVALIATIGVVWSNNRSNSAADTAGHVQRDANGDVTRIPVMAEPIRYRDVTRHVTYYGVLQPRTTVQLAVEVGGRVHETPVDVGDRVAAGDVLLRLGTFDLEAQVRQAEAGLALATAQLERLLSGATAEELAQARAGVAQAEAQFENAQTEFRRTERLFQSGSVSRQAHDGAQSQLNIARSQLDSAKARLEQVQKGAVPEEIASAEAQVHQALAALDLAESQLEKASLKAPVAGIVSHKGIEVGEIAVPGNPIMTLVDVDELALHLKAPGQDVVAVQPGMTVNITVEDDPTLVYEGRLHRVGVVADPVSNLFNLEIRLNNDDERLRPGFNASARLRVAEARDVLAVPERAITHRDNVEGFYVVRDDRAHFIPAEFGISDGRTWREVVHAEGVEAEDLVITVGKEYVTPGVPVRVQREGSTTTR